MRADVFEAYSSPQTVTPAVVAARDAIARVFALHPVGGRLHAVIEDGALDEQMVAGIRETLSQIEPDDDYNSPEMLAAERECCEALLRLSFEERVAALALYEGYI